MSKYFSTEDESLSPTPNSNAITPQKEALKGCMWINVCCKHFQSVLTNVVTITSPCTQ